MSSDVRRTTIADRSVDDACEAWCEAGAKNLYDDDDMKHMRAALEAYERTRPPEAARSDAVDRAWDAFNGCAHLPLSLWGKLEVAVTAALATPSGASIGEGGLGDAGRE